MYQSTLVVINYSYLFVDIFLSSHVNRANQFMGNTVIPLDKACFSIEKYYYFSYFATKTYVVVLNCLSGAISQ